MDIPQDESQVAEEVNETDRSETDAIERPDVNEVEEVIELKRVNFKEIVHKDLIDVNTETKRMVDLTKSNISDLINFCNKDNSKILPTFERDIKTRTAAHKLIRQGLYEAKEKAKTDLQVIQLYDKSLTNEIQDHIKKDVIDKNFTTIKEKTKTDFQTTQENTENMVIETKSTVENFITIISENVAKDEGNDNTPGSELWQKMKNKAQKDFTKSNEKAQKLSSKTIYQIQENINIFFTNPTGSKSKEELESEEFVKENILEVSEKIKEDILREKVNFSRIVEETRGNVGLNLLFPKNGDKDLETNKTKLIRMYDKTRNDFREVNEKLQEDITTLKEHIDIPDETTVGSNDDVPDLLNNFSETAQADFKKTNTKIQENVKDFKLIITQSTPVKDDPETFERQQEVSKVIESRLNEFHDMAKNDFQETNDKVMDNVEIAKSRIDKSLNKLKDHLFFKGL